MANDVRNNCSPASHRSRVIPVEALDALIDLLGRSGRSVIGPTVRDGAVMLEPIETARDLPHGWVEVQEAGSYRLERDKKAGYFDFTHGPETWKRHLFPPRERLWSVTREPGGDGLSFTAGDEAPAQAFVGVRACELHAIGIHDRVFVEGQYQVGTYRARRDKAFIVAVNCRRAGGTCFCVSMGTGPKAGEGFDLALTELTTAERHEFLVEVGSEEGARILAELPSRPAEDADMESARRAIARAADGMGREMPENARDLLADNLEHPQWQDVAKRCLTCGNCTMVCPTCFCNTITDSSSLDGSTAERWRHWDSCFTLDFGFIHGGSVRRAAAHRYRQWITHKLSHWHDQFGASGCVGCGRCITWCPVGIDITAEVHVISNTQGGT